MALLKPAYRIPRVECIYEIGLKDGLDEMINYGNPILKNEKDLEAYKNGVKEAKRRKIGEFVEPVGTKN